MGVAFPKKTIRDCKLNHRTILLRTDYNVPLDLGGNVISDFRIKASLPTLKYLLRRQCKVVVISHLGRPDGREERYSLLPVAQRLSNLLQRPVIFLRNIFSEDTEKAIASAQPGAVIVLENLRFYKGELTNGREFARRLADLTRADYFVQDAFGVVHRLHASTSAITRCLPSIAGLLVEREYTTLNGVMQHASHPFVALIGGAKAADKLSVIQRLSMVADKVLLGEIMSNTFLKYKDFDVAASDRTARQSKLLDDLRDSVPRDRIVTPVDVAVSIHNGTARKEIPLRELSHSDEVLDIGEHTMRLYETLIAGAKTILWNGPMGYVENDLFAYGSARMALAIAQNQSAKRVIGGGDTSSFVLRWSDGDSTMFDYISTGGGASLDLLAGKTLPGINNLLDA